MSVFEIINPSDKVLIQTDNFEAAALVVLMAGDGKYGLQEIDGERGVPMFFMGGSEEWYKKTFSHGTTDGLRRLDKEILAAAFDSARVGDITRTKDQSDKATSSLNNIAAYCWKCAEAIRENIAKGAYHAS